MHRPVLALLATLCALLTGCASYKLGPTGDIQAGARSVTVEAFRNDTIEPRLIEYISQSLRKAVQRDGTFKLDTHNTGDLVISGVISQYQRTGVGFQPSDVLTVRDYSLNMTAHVTVKERSTGRIVVQKDFVGRATIRAGSDLSSAERQAAPLLAEDMARKISDHLADGAW
ncbi:MAG TPA: LptE family protein [Roseimicrobium sp.]|nr:LptE family protein [Roseimicrobium sp.]